MMQVTEFLLEAKEQPITLGRFSSSGIWQDNLMPEDAARPKVISSSELKSKELAQISRDDIIGIIGAAINAGGIEIKFSMPEMFGRIARPAEGKSTVWLKAADDDIYQIILQPGQTVITKEPQQ